MAERMNGKAPFTRRTHGSERRGATPVPAPTFADRQRQSFEDRNRLRVFVRQQKEHSVDPTDELGIGNRELPAFKHKFELVANIEAHKAVIVGGETGSGKSTQLPQYLLEAGYDLTIMLVPRRVIADGLGDRIRVELTDQIEGIDANETVGIIHGERVERHEGNKILVMTPNTFVRMEKELRKTYGDKKVAIVADEIHEANLFTEIAVGVAALSVRDKEKWRLVAASATHNAETLQRPFQKLNGGYVPTVEIKGRPFNVELREEPELNPMQAYASDDIDHEKAMIFTSGKKEIKYIISETRRELEAREKGSSRNVIFRVLHGDLTETELSHINDPVPEGCRLVIVSSPAGMSGITIPGVTYVATDGTINRSEIDEYNASGLRRHYLSKAGITQQIGRAGRDVAGGLGVLCAPVITKRKNRLDPKNIKRLLNQEQDSPTLGGMPYMAFSEREEHEPPEIYNTILSRIVLSVAALGYNFSELNEYIPHPVQQLDIINAEEALARLGALDDDGKVTGVGLGMDQFPLTPELARGLYEASRPGRTLQHMARAAFIAAAVDVGGLQDHQADEGAARLRKQIIRPSSDDDFLAQLDLMMKLFERTDEEWTGYEFVERHGLHPKRVERVRKTVRKIFAVMNIKPQNIIITPPNPEEEQKLRDDFTAGFLDYIYKQVGNAPRSRKPLYGNIHEGSMSVARKISDRSVARVPRDSLIAGMPRWYLKGARKDGTPIQHDIVDLVLRVDPDVVGRHALRNGLVQGVLVGSRMQGDKVVVYEQGTFGSLSVGAPVERTAVEVMSQSSQDLLFDYVIRYQGRAQKALRELVKALEGYRARTPNDVLMSLRSPNAPPDLTQDDITAMIRDAVRTISAAHEVDEKLRKETYGSNITLLNYYDSESLEKLNEMSPPHIIIGGAQISVRYDNGGPYVTNLTKRLLARVQGPLYLEDGREVLYQRRLSGSGVERVSFGDLRVV